MTGEKDDIDSELDRWLEEPEATKACRESTVGEFRAQLRDVLREELASFKQQLDETIRDANRAFLASFKAQTEKVLAQSAKSAALKTKEFVLRTMQTVREGEDEGGKEHEDAA